MCSLPKLTLGSDPGRSTATRAGGERARSSKGALSNAVLKAAALLRCFDADGQELGVSEFAKRLGITASTAYRLAGTLRQAGLLEQNPESEKYRLGLGIVELTRFVMNGIPVRRLALPHLATLALKSGANANLGILWDDAVLYLARVPSPKVQDTYFHSGRKVPAHCTALGKALIAALPEADRRALVARLPLPALTQKTITDRRRLDEHLLEVDLRGFAVDSEEHMIRSHCIAAPVRGTGGELVGAVSLSTTLLDMRPDELLGHVPDLLEAARATSYSMGHHLP
jgi:IclR family transcriptional regulator, KDG regulon repressor